MNMLFEGLKEKGSMVTAPSSALDSMNLGAMGGLISLSKSNEQMPYSQPLKNPKDKITDPETKELEPKPGVDLTKDDK